MAPHPDLADVFPRQGSQRGSVIASAFLRALTLLMTTVALPASPGPGGLGGSSAGISVATRQVFSLPAKVAHGEASPESLDMRSAVIALLASNRIVAVDPQTGTVLSERSLAATPAAPDRFAGHYLAFSPDTTRLFVLLPARTPDENRLVVVETTTMQVLRSNLLPPSDVVFRSLAVGPRTGKLYLFGNRDGAAVISVLEPASGHVETTWVAREADGHTWAIYQGAVSADERSVFVSYHGPDTTGIDWFHLAGAEPQRCQDTSEREGTGCLDTHGGFVLQADGLLAATGQSAVVEFDQDGQPRRRIETGLVHNHLIEFVVDASSERLYAVGSCAYARGFTAVSLVETEAPATPMATEVTAGKTSPDQRGDPELPKIPCGESVALGPDNFLVVGQVAPWIANPIGRGTMLLVDAATGRIVRSVELSAEPIDVAVLPLATGNHRPG